MKQTRTKLFINYNLEHHGKYNQELVCFSDRTAPLLFLLPLYMMQYGLKFIRFPQSLDNYQVKAKTSDV